MEPEKKNMTYSNSERGRKLASTTVTVGATVWGILA